MTVITSKPLMTAEEFAQLPERVDGCREELVRGEIVVTPPPGFPHGSCAMRLGARLQNWVEAQGRGRATMETGVITTVEPDSVRGPDLAYWSAERLPLDVMPQVYADVSPDLCVEILSPGNRRGDMEDKTREYFASGVRVVWLVDTAARTVTVVRPNGPREVLDEAAILKDDEVLPGFSCRVGEIF